MIPVRRIFTPDPALGEMFNRQYRVFTSLYKNNRKSFAALRVREKITSQN